MRYDEFFSRNIQSLKDEGRYRIFATLERQVGRFPKALYHMPDGGQKEITIWCSNDYLGMGQNPKVLAAMHEAIYELGRRHGARGISPPQSTYTNLEP